MNRFAASGVVLAACLLGIASGWGWAAIDGMASRGNADPASAGDLIRVVPPDDVLAGAAGTDRLALPSDVILTDRPAFVTVHPGEGWAGLARRVGVGWDELRAANPAAVQGGLQLGAQLRVPQILILPPGTRRGIVVNLAERRLWLFEDTGAVRVYPIAVGRGEGWTPLGETEIVRKRDRPVWVPTPAMRARDPGLPAFVPAGAANPLGLHALDLGWTHYRIHGTNRPASIGRQASAGCIRLYPEHIADLFARVATGTPVRVIDVAVKTGQDDDGAWWIERAPGASPGAAGMAERLDPPEAAAALTAQSG